MRGERRSGQRCTGAGAGAGWFSDSCGGAGADRAASELLLGRFGRAPSRCRRGSPRPGNSLVRRRPLTIHSRQCGNGRPRHGLVLVQVRLREASCRPRIGRPSQPCGLAERCRPLATAVPVPRSRRAPNRARVAPTRRQRHIGLPGLVRAVSVRRPCRAAPARRCRGSHGDLRVGFGQVVASAALPDLGQLGNAANRPGESRAGGGFGGRWQRRQPEQHRTRPEDPARPRHGLVGEAQRPRARGQQQAEHRVRVLATQLRGPERVHPGQRQQRADDEDSRPAADTAWSTRASPPATQATSAVPEQVELSSR